MDQCFFPFFLFCTFPGHFSPRSRRLPRLFDHQAPERFVFLTICRLIKTKNQSKTHQIEAAKAANVACKVTLPDGSQRDAVAGVSTPHDVALGISKSLAKDIVVAKVCI